jgi:hypothetical protein
MKMLIRSRLELRETRSLFQQGLPQSGTSLTIGASGDTITIPSGATITNSGTATGFGKVLQVVSTTVSASRSTSSATYVDISGASASITPSSASNKILVLANAPGAYASQASGGATCYGRINIVRTSTQINQGLSGWYITVGIATISDRIHVLCTVLDYLHNF